MLRRRVTSPHEFQRCKWQPGQTRSRAGLAQLRVAGSFNGFSTVGYNILTMNFNNLQCGMVALYLRYSLETVILTFHWYFGCLLSTVLNRHSKLKNILASVELRFHGLPALISGTSDLAEFSNDFSWWLLVSWFFWKQFMCSCRTRGGRIRSSHQCMNITTITLKMVLIVTFTNSFKNLKML